jgi:beta-phosphoglucomutase-like phosphatase (HAD superfamily)
LVRRPSPSYHTTLALCATGTGVLNLPTVSDPELYLLALARLSLEPHAALVFEDAPNGVLAAKRAGIFTIAVPNALTCDLPLDHADLRVASLADLPLTALLAALERRAAPSASHGEICGSAW